MSFRLATFLLIFSRVFLSFALEFKYSENLGSDVALSWNFANESITIKVSAPTKGWISIGISPDGGFPGSDASIGGLNGSGKYVEDVYGPETGGPKPDESQDVEILSAEENDTSTTIIVQRKLKTGDQNDIDIQRGNLYVLWAYGSSDVWGRPGPGSRPNQRGVKEMVLVPDTDDVNFIHTTMLDEEKKISLKWYYTDEDITFKFLAPTTGWTALGFSRDGKFPGSDACIAGRKDNMNYVEDVYGPEENGPPRVDESQDYEVLSAKQGSDSTTLVIRRKLLTGDAHDVDIKAGKIFVTWAFGNIDEWKGPDPSTNPVETGVKEMVLIPEESSE
ncbi:uncharacterized protein LOC120338411 [Styela clava]|uniref:uncharacterized protein LOC120338411 n=1 Tax=Styela clava TaxID=7725 RepID=UPI00193AC2AB|nr:uncharacterized protein LOC120338411 [Styela clava]